MAEARTLEEIKLDNAYKFGAGRYIQQRQALETVAEEAGRLGENYCGPESLGSHGGQDREDTEGSGHGF